MNLAHQFSAFDIVEIQGRKIGQMKEHRKEIDRIEFGYTTHT